MIVDEDVYLEHYGVLGMKWGVRKERKYQEKQAKRAAKAKKHLDKASILSTRISELETGPRRFGKKKKIAKLSEERQTEIENAMAKSQGKLTEKQKKVLKGAAIAGGIVAAGTAYSLIQSGSGRRLVEKGKDFFKDKHDPGWKLDRSLADTDMAPDEIMSKVVSKINPEFGATGTKMNCRRATFAYEMRRRGYDVQATRTTNAHGQNVVGVFNALDSKQKDLPAGRFGIAANVKNETISKLIKKPLIGENQVAADQIFKELKKLPNGARGEFGMTWISGGGHSMAFEVVKGKPVIFDTQTGIKYSKYADLKELIGNMSDAGYTRLDNKTLDTNYLMRWVRNA